MKGKKSSIPKFLRLKKGNEIMKKVYITPCMEMTAINAEAMMCLSGETMGFKSGTTEVVESNERRGIFSNEDESGYDRTLW